MIFPLVKVLFELFILHKYLHEIFQQNIFLYIMHTLPCTVWEMVWTTPVVN